MYPEEGVKQFILNPNKYDLIITDLMMAKMSGLDVISEVHNIRKDLPVAIFTGIGRFYPEGIYVIPKPCDHETLMKHVEELLTSEFFDVEDFLKKSVNKLLDNSITKEEFIANCMENINSHYILI